MRKFARAARKEFGGRLQKNRDPHVVGSLARRGLVQRRKDLSGFFTRTHWSWTDPLDFGAADFSELDGAFGAIDAERFS